MENPEGCVATLYHNRTIPCLSWHKWSGQHRDYILKMIVNGASMTFDFVSWKMQGLAVTLIDHRAIGLLSMQKCHRRHR